MPDATIYRGHAATHPVGQVELWSWLGPLVAAPERIAAGGDSPDPIVRNAAKAALPYFCRALQSYRNRKGTAAITGAVLDFDHAPEDRVRAELAALGWCGALYPSPSHFASSDWRVRFVPFAAYSRPLGWEEHRAMYRWIRERCPSADPALATGTTGVYAPAVSDANRGRWWADWLPGAVTIDVDAILGDAPDEPRPRAEYDVDAREPKHPMPLAQRLDLYRSAVRDCSLPARRGTSGALQGERGMQRVRQFVFAGITLGVPFADILAHVWSVRGDWTEDEIESVVANAWRYSHTVAWEAGLPASVAEAPAEPGDPNAVLVAGAPGSGKTNLVVATTRDAASLLWITPRVKQAIDAHQRAGLVLYGEDGDRDTRRLSTTAQSVHKYLGRRWHTVVIDEIATTVGEIDARAYEAIARACAEAKRVVCVGADVTGPVFGIACEMVGRRMSVVTLPAPPLERVLVIRHANVALESVLQDRPGCTFVAMDMSVRAQALGQHLASKGKRVGVFVGGKGTVPTNEDVARLDYIIATHSMAEAINLTAQISRVVVLHTYKEVHRDTMLQLLARARNVVDPVVLVGEPAWSLGVPLSAEDIADRITAAGGKKEPAGALRARWLRDVRRADAMAFPSLQWTSVYPVASVDLANPGPGEWSADIKWWCTWVRETDGQAVVDAPPMASLPVRPNERERAGRHHHSLLEHGLAADLDTAVADRSGAVRRKVRRAALAGLRDSDREILCERLEPDSMADRRGLLARARIDAAFLDAWRENADRDWYEWARSRRRRLVQAGMRAPGKDSAMDWAEAWWTGLDADLFAQNKWLESVGFSSREMSGCTSAVGAGAGRAPAPTARYAANA